VQSLNSDADVGVVENLLAQAVCVDVCACERVCVFACVWRYIKTLLSCVCACVRVCARVTECRLSNIEFTVDNLKE
jgi:hypothetical protein